MIAEKIKIVEVGPRDGLQNEDKILNSDVKIQFIELLAKAGLTSIEVTSFVSPKAIPQMNDAHEVYTGLNSKLKNNLSLPCLVPNMKGYESAMKAQVKEIALFSATSDLFSKKNINASVSESLTRLSEVATQAKRDKIKMRGYISTAFGCPYEGDPGYKKLDQVMKKFFEWGVGEVSIGDTIGVARPSQVESYLTEIKKSYDLNLIAMHFHDTRSMALTNIYQSLKMGVRIFDSSAAGLGGCPYAVGASGNVATEDLWYLLHGLGFESGVSLPELLIASDFILKHCGHTNRSKFANAYVKTGRI